MEQIELYNVGGDEREEVGSWFGTVKQCTYLLGAESNLAVWGARHVGWWAGSVVGSLVGSLTLGDGSIGSIILGDYSSHMYINVIHHLG
jgi:hypothetical protein